MAGCRAGSVVLRAKQMCVSFQGLIKNWVGCGWQVAGWGHKVGFDLRANQLGVSS